jgi:hypothetical protein
MFRVSLKSYDFHADSLMTHKSDSKPYISEVHLSSIAQQMKI